MYSWFSRIATLALGAALAAAPLALLGQQAEPPSAPSPTPAAPEELSFDKPNPANFNADSPSLATVNSFLEEFWGFDGNRAWQVEAITKTAAPGLTRVLIEAGQKNNASQKGTLEFLILPDGKHLIANGDQPLQVLPFGAHPFEENRQLLVNGVNGPARGAAGTDLLLVEFADFQCPHCKDAQPNIEKLMQDFPNARLVFENFPLPMHSEAYKAAAYGVCVQKQAGDAAFFTFASAVFENQAALTPDTSDAALKDAVVNAKANPAQVIPCSTSAETKATLEAQKKLGESVAVNSTPTLFVNGRALPVGGLSYDELKIMVAYQSKLNGKQ